MIAFVTAHPLSVLRALVRVGWTTRLWSLAGCAAFILLAWWQIAHHLMWRDELQAWQIAVASHSPADLFARLRYEGHPGLWYLLLWAAGFVTTDPRAMQVIQAAIAAALIGYVWLKLPFQLRDKLLMSCSYFLVFEYTVMSRSYGLGILLTLFAMGGWQSRAPSAGFGLGLLPWAMLGFAANASFYNAMLAGILAGWRLWTTRPPRWRLAREQVAGVALFGVLTILAIATMWPATDVVKANPHGGNWSELRILDAAVQLLRTFLPIHQSPGFKVWEPIPFDTLRPYLALTPPLVWLLAQAVGNSRPAIYAVLAVAAGTAFFTIASYPAAIRHTGMIFIMFLLMAWDAVSRGRLRAGFLTAVLCLNAVGGVIVVAGTVAKPFSYAEAVARWFDRNDLDKAFIAASPQPFVNLVSGYLRRPLYYPDCECFGTYMIWRKDPQIAPLRSAELGRRLDEAMRARNLRRLYLVNLKWAEAEADPIGDAAALGLVVTRMVSFDGANDSEENYDIFRIDRADSWR